MVEAITGVNLAPVITLISATPTTILDTESTQLNVIANDPDTGPNLELSYNWSVQSGDGSLDNSTSATPVYTPADVSSTQTITLGVEVSDGESTVNQSIDITVLDADAPPPSVFEDFGTGSINGWTIVDEGTVQGPSSWSAATEELVQNSNIFSDPLDPEELSKFGSYIYYNTGFGWNNYRFSLALRSDDDDAIGVMFRYQDPDNYYRFSWDKSRTYRRLVKNQGGVFTQLAGDSVPYVQGQIYQLEITLNGPQIEVFIDGALVFTVIDSGLAQGSVALYTWGNMPSRFDDVMVEDL